MITTSDGEIYEDETAHALGVQKQTKVASNSKEDIFLPSTAYPKDTRPLVKEYKGTPAEIYNLYRGSGASHDDAIQATREHIRKSQDDIAGKTFRGDYPKFDTDEDLEEFLKTFKGSQNEQKPVTQITQMAMNMENIQPSGKVEHRGGVLDMRQNLQNSMLRSNAVGESVILKDNPLNAYIGKAMSGIHDRHQERINQSLMKAKREMDWVKDKWKIPGDENNIPFDNEYDIDYAQPPPKAPGS